MTTSEGGPVIVLFLAVGVVLVLRWWVRPYLDEAIASRKSLTNGEPYEPPSSATVASGRERRLHRIPGHGRAALLLPPLLPFAVLADPRIWLRDALSDCAEAESVTVRVLVVVSHICSAPSRIWV